MRGQSNHLATLDGLRGVAALAVLLHHIAQITGHNELSPHAYLAVDFFFMLSGFVVAKAYEARLATAMTFVDFAKVRLVRLYPMIFVGVLLGAFVSAVKMITTHVIAADNLMLATLSALAMLPTTSLFALHFGMLYPVNAPEWSLFFELAVNFFYASIVRWLSAKRLAMLCVLSGTILCLAVPMLPDALNVGHRVENFFWGFPRVAFSFFLGVLLFRYRPAYRLKSFASLGLALLLGIALFAPLPKSDWAYDLIAVALIFPPIVFFGSLCESRPVLTALWLWLGELSYPLYITHYPMIRLIKNGVDLLHLHVAVAVTAITCAAGSIIAAQVLLIVWDRPVRGAVLRGASPARTVRSS